MAADLALVTAGVVGVSGIPIIQDTQPFAETCAVGDVVRIDATTGGWTGAKGTDATEALAYGILVSKDAAGAVGTAVRKGVLSGYDLSALNYGVKVYLSDTDKTLADTAGTVTVIAGRVIAGRAEPLGTAAAKLLFVDF